MGFGMTVPLIFDSINVSVTPYIFDSTKSISLPWYIASAVDSLAVVAAITIAVIVRRKEKRIKN
jgi:predicted membrane-bound mannosyltransferase